MLDVMKEYENEFDSYCKSKLLVYKHDDEATRGEKLKKKIKRTGKGVVQ